MKFVLIAMMLMLTQCSTLSNLYNKHKIIKKVIQGEDHWFEEISQIYEEVIYQYDDYEDELSLGHQMDLGKLINDYDKSEDCFEEDISVYEYYDEEQIIEQQDNLQDNVQSVIVKKDQQNIHIKQQKNNLQNKQIKTKDK